jgi:hypothetical protein
VLKRPDFVLRDSKGYVGLIIDRGQKEPVAVIAENPELSGGVLPPTDNAPYSTRDAQPPYSVDWTDWSAGAGQRSYENADASYRRFRSDRRADISLVGDVAIGPYPLVLDFDTTQGKLSDAMDVLEDGSVLVARSPAASGPSNRLMLVLPLRAWSPTTHVLPDASSTSLDLDPGQSGEVVASHTYLYCTNHGELVFVTGKNGSVATVERGAGGTVATAHSADCVWVGWAGHFAALPAAVEQGTLRTIPVQHITDDGRFVYVAFHDPASSDSNGFVLRGDMQTNLRLADNWSQWSDNANIVRLAYSGGYMYGVRKNYNSSTIGANAEIGYFTKSASNWVFNSLLTSGVTLPGSQFVDMTPVGNYVYATFCGNERSVVYRVCAYGTVFQQAAEFPKGFIARASCAHGGMLYVVGRYGDDLYVYTVSGDGDVALVCAIEKAGEPVGIHGNRRWLYIVTEGDIYRYDLGTSGWSHYSDLSQPLEFGVYGSGEELPQWQHYVPNELGEPTPTLDTLGWTKAVSSYGNYELAFKYDRNYERGFTISTWKTVVDSQTKPGYVQYVESFSPDNGGATIEAVVGGEWYLNVDEEKSGSFDGIEGMGGGLGIAYNGRFIVANLRRYSRTIDGDYSGHDRYLSYFLADGWHHVPVTSHLGEYVRLRVVADNKRCVVSVGEVPLVVVPRSQLRSVSEYEPLLADNSFIVGALSWLYSSQMKSLLGIPSSPSRFAIRSLSWIPAPSTDLSLPYYLISRPTVMADGDGTVYAYSSDRNRLALVPRPELSQSRHYWMKYSKRDKVEHHSAEVESSVSYLRMGGMLKTFCYIEVEHTALQPGQSVGVDVCIDDVWHPLRKDWLRSTPTVSVFPVNINGRNISYRLYLDDDEPTRLNGDRLYVRRVSVFFVPALTRKQINVIASATSKTYAHEHDPKHAIERVFEMAGSVVDVESIYYTGKALIAKVVEVPVPSNASGYDERQSRLQVVMRTT